MPVGRSSFGSALHKQRIVFFGGCADAESKDDNLNSRFFNDIHAFDMSRCRFFSICLKKGGADGKKKRRRKAGKKKKAAAKADAPVENDETLSSSDSDNSSSDEDLGVDKFDDIQEDKFYYYNSNGILVEIDMDADDDSNEDEKGEQGEDGSDSTSDSANAHSEAKKSASNALEAEGKPTAMPLEKKVSSDASAGKVAPSAPAQENEPLATPPAQGSVAVSTNHEKENRSQTQEDDGDLDGGTVAESLKPRASAEETAALNTDRDSSVPRERFNSTLCVRGNTMYVFGGMWEDRDKRFTMDDLWALDLTKLQKWEQLCDLSEESQQWQGSDDDDDDDDEEEGDDEDGNKKDLMMMMMMMGGKMLRKVLRVNSTRT